MALRNSAAAHFALCLRSSGKPGSCYQSLKVPLRSFHSSKSESGSKSKIRRSNQILTHVRYQSEYSQQAVKMGTVTSLKLMPLGGSITFGSGSSDGNGYRKVLYDMLVAEGYHVDMVGSRRSGSMANNDNEGWRGYRIDQIGAKALKSIPILLPNVITINAGSNDCIQHLDMDHIGTRMSTMLENIWSMSPETTLILSTLLRSVDEETELCIQTANRQFTELVAQKAAENRKIVLVDMHCPEGPQNDELTDGTHPNDSGYRKMARIWMQGFREAAAKTYLQIQPAK